jgi:hypothetical protein
MKTPKRSGWSLLSKPVLSTALCRREDTQRNDDFAGFPTA